MLTRLLLALCLALIAKPVSAQPPPDFDREVAPLLARRCLDCHSGDHPKGKLDLTTRAGALKGGKNGPALVPGKPEDGELWDRVHNGTMPPKKPLPDAEKVVLRRWIEAGAAWGESPIDLFRHTTDTRAGYDWWSLRPVVRPAVPAVKAADWPRNPIDHFILARLEARGLRPSAEADRHALIRRVTFDLIGLPPTPEEVEAFVADPAPDAYERVVDRLLSSPHHGERWARHWLDVARFGESNGFEHDELRKNAWPYRDWVVKAINDDLPYDIFARLQLAGDVPRPGDPSAVAATGFLVAGGYDTVGQAQQSAVMKATVRQDELEDLVGTVSQTFLGLTAHCARCHDHKFDPVRQSEYYRLTAAFAGVRHGERDVTSPDARRTHESLVAEQQAALRRVREQLAALERPVRERVLAERKKAGKTVMAPAPLARWDFTKGPKDLAGGLDVKLHGDAALRAEGLVLGGKEGYASTPPLAADLGARTLSAWVKLDNLTQRGGAVVTLQTLDGQMFDAIVFGEREPGRWVAGSDFFRRTRDLGGPAEREADRRPIHIAVTHAADGTITMYREGHPHGKPYRAAGPVTFAAGKARVVFGVRHTPAAPGRMLAGTIVRAEVHARALSVEEVAALAGTATDFVSRDEILAGLDGTARAHHERLEAELHRLQKPLPAPPRAKVYAVTPRPAEVTHVLARGDVRSKGAVVTPGGVAALAGVRADFGLPPDAPDGDRRRKLADWITDARNPLFARVIVNRLWHHHFGVGIVETPSDLGFSGGRPSHPELLDWLADELVRQKWSLRVIHRLIVTSSAYRQAARLDPAAAKVDAGNRLLWRRSPARLEAEALRDAMLSAAGRLNKAMGGPGYQDFDVTVRGATYLYSPADRVGPEFERRSVYRTWARSGRNRLLDALDCPDPSAATPGRATTTTPLQALALLNNAFVLRAADDFAERLRREAGADAVRQIELAYQLAYGRPAARDEIERARPVVEAHGLAVLCRAIFNSNEFVYVD